MYIRQKLTIYLFVEIFQTQTTDADQAAKNILMLTC